MATSEFTTIGGRSCPRVSENSAPKAFVAAGSGVKPFTEVHSTGVEGTLPLARAPYVAQTFRSRRMTVSYVEADTPCLRFRGQWLHRVGFGVRTSVRIAVSEGRLIVEAVAPEGRSRCAEAKNLHEGNGEVPGGGAAGRAAARKSQSVRSWTEAATWYSRIEHALAEALKAVLPSERRRERVTERALADRAQLNAELIRKVETGRSLPSIPVLVVLAWSLDLDPRQLFDRLLKQMNYPDGCRPVLVNRAPPDIPRDSAGAI